MGAMTEFEIPFPPSLNHYYRHVGPRVLSSREGRSYRSRVMAMLAGTPRQPGGLEMEKMEGEQHRDAGFIYAPPANAERHR